MKTCLKGNRRTRVTFPVFNGYQVRVILARDVRRTCRRLREKVEDAEAAFLTRPERPGVGWIVLGPTPDAGTIAHEASHAVQELFRYAGARRDEEVFAYHLDYLVRRIHGFVDRGQEDPPPIG